jgi:LuxR family transcriptional regulator, maltose regulon positive regulatory protein
MIAACAPPLLNLIKPLSTRELEVLRRLRTDVSGPEIAPTLTLSTKLGIGNHRAAVRRAEKLGLF